MKALVTGANGFLGTAVVRALLLRGENDLRCFVRLGSDVSRLEATVGKYPTATVDIVAGTLGNLADISRALNDVDVVYHLAATMRGAPADIFRGCVVNSQHLIQAIKNTGRSIRVVLVSSFGVYGAQDSWGTPLLTEESPIEANPELRDVYSYAKIWQERIFWEARGKQGLPLVVVRPGVVYGPRGVPISSRVGIELFGLFVNLGGRNVLPLTYVDNCAEAIALLGRAAPDGEVYNITDDDLPNCNGYLYRYRREVKKLRTLRLNYGIAYLLSILVEFYARWSKGQLPPVITRYKLRSTWKGRRFTNHKLKKMGWKQSVPTQAALAQTFAALRASER